MSNQKQTQQRPELTKEEAKKMLEKKEALVKSGKPIKK